MCLSPDKFLWPDLFKFWQDKSPETVSQCAQILSKADVITDPGEQMEQLVIVLAQRSLLGKCLLQVDRIKLSIAKLVRVMEKLASLEQETIQACLQEDSSKWETLAIQSSNLEETKDQKLSSEQVADFYKEHTAGLKDVVPLEKMYELSKLIQSEVEDYRHCELQACIAGVAVSQASNFTIVVCPTGSGKTWIQGLVAKYYCSLGKKALVVEPNEALMKQSTEKLALVDYAINITSIERLYEEGPWHDVIILDEFDSIFNNTPFLPHQQGIKGLWQFKGRKVFAFSATTSNSYERLVHNSIERPTTLKFKSEYELVNGVNPVADPAVIQCEDNAKLLRQVSFDLAKLYDTHPIIIILNPEQREDVKKLLRENKYRFLETANEMALDEVKQWEYGVLLLNPDEGRGVDTRFKKTAHVMVMGKVVSLHELQQMIGRSSRTRGVCEGTVYTVGAEKSHQVMDRLKRHSVVALQELERLISLIERKAKDNALIRRLSEAREHGESVRSLEDLKRGMEEAAFNKLIKASNQ